MDGKSLLYCGEHRPLERGTYNVYVDVVLASRGIQRITDGLRLKDRVSVYFEDAGGVVNGTGESEKERNNAGDSTTTIAKKREKANRYTLLRLASMAQRRRYGRRYFVKMIKTTRELSTWQIYP